MAQYNAPGVYVEAVDRGPKPIEGVSTSVAGFLGESERGPTDPQLITSFKAFRRVFGTDTSSNLSSAVDGFFRNGGGQCYVGRVVPTAWLPTSETDVPDEVGTVTLGQSSGNDDALSVRAIGPGNWTTGIAIEIDDATMGSDDAFSATVGYWSELGESDDYELGSDDYEDLVGAFGAADVEENYDNLEPDERAQNYYENRVNGPSNLVEFVMEDGGRPENGTVILTADVGSESVAATDYTGETATYRRVGLEAFTEIDEIALVCIPDDYEYDLHDDIVEHCETQGDRFAVLQSDHHVDVQTVQGMPGELTDSSYAALYYPWLTVRNPETNLEMPVPPGGHVAGLIARTDTGRGVHKAPANEVVRGITGLEATITKNDQALLNPKGVNCIRSFPGRGVRVWGARTISSDPSWKYVNVRRLFLYLRESIDQGTQWVVFEPNDEQTWARVRQTIRNFLTGVWNDGALTGSTPEEAFYVKCDRSTMTQDDIDNGRLVCEIGVAPVKPAEFVVFRIAQWSGSGE